ncbi:IS1016 group transposase [Neisseria elongata]|uniref:IS1016 group transposase n=1 Tax=Neisseria elongata TaxID=495 RepID=A0A378TUU4_NEIEL|nr:IS1016 group transposase [Neisseria elongata]
MSSVSCCTICNSISLFPSRPIPHHPTSSHLSHHSYIFISLGFKNQAKYILRKYNGIDCKSFPLFLKECEFQFNFGAPSQQLQTLRD